MTQAFSVTDGKLPEGMGRAWQNSRFTQRIKRNAVTVKHLVDDWRGQVGPETELKYPNRRD